MLALLSIGRIRDDQLVVEEDIGDESPWPKVIAD
jgi:hypothetical protein